MARPPAEDKGAWNFREIPRGLMQRVKMAAAYEGKTVKQWLMDLARARLAEMEKRGIFKSFVPLNTPWSCLGDLYCGCLPTTIST